METIKVNGKTYRIKSSIIEGKQKLVNAYNSLGIADYVNALPPRSRVASEQVFIMLDGTAMIADSRIVRKACMITNGKL
jgi:hypothetical protein